VENLLKTLRPTFPDALLCLNGALPSSNVIGMFRSKQCSIPIIAADGAATQLETLHITPDYIIGDLDSLTHKQEYWRHKGVNVIRIEEQESTDFEKSLSFAQRQQWRSVMVCGFHGGDLDHTLNNWSIVTRYGRTMNLCIYDAGKVGIPLYESVSIQAKKGMMISLIPQPRVVLTTTGLQWELRQEALALGVREGARNRAQQESVHLEIHEGSVFVMLEAELPKMLQVL
jgi:thiamine pyrophosphokinase